MDQAKTQSTSLNSFGQNEGLEFQLTDVADARRILDTESMAQFDVATVALSAPQPLPVFGRHGCRPTAPVTGRAIGLGTLKPKDRQHPPTSRCRSAETMRR